MHAAWRRQLKYWHPDRGNHPDALEHAKLINLAHDVLTNSNKRAAYDRQRAAVGWRPSASARHMAAQFMDDRGCSRCAPRDLTGTDSLATEEMMNRGRPMIKAQGPGVCVQMEVQPSLAAR